MTTTKNSKPENAAPEPAVSKAQQAANEAAKIKTKNNGNHIAVERKKRLADANAKGVK